MNYIALQPQFWIVPIVGALLIIVGLALFIPGRRINRKAGSYSMDGEGMIVFGGVVTGLGVAAFLVLLILLIPYDIKYLSYYNVEGVVEGVTRTFVQGSGDLTNVPVVNVTGFDTALVVEDARVYNYVGQDVNFTCSVEWVPYGADRLNCFIAGVK